MSNKIIVRSVIISANRAQIAYTSGYNQEPARQVWVEIRGNLPTDTKDKRFNLEGELSFGFWDEVEGRLISADNRFGKKGFMYPRGFRVSSFEETQEKHSPTWGFETFVNKETGEVSGPVFNKDGKDQVCMGKSNSLTSKSFGVWVPYKGNLDNLLPVVGPRGIAFFKPAPVKEDV